MLDVQGGKASVKANRAAAFAFTRRPGAGSSQYILSIDAFTVRDLSSWRKERGKGEEKRPFNPCFEVSPTLVQLSPYRVSKRTHRP